MVLLVTPGHDYAGKAETVDWENKDRNRAQLEIPKTVIVLQ